jgi:hypothetical protein
VTREIYEEGLDQNEDGKAVPHKMSTVLHKVAGEYFRTVGL